MPSHIRPVKLSCNALWHASVINLSVVMCCSTTSFIPKQENHYYTHILKHLGWVGTMGRKIYFDNNVCARASMPGGFTLGRTRYRSNLFGLMYTITNTKMERCIFTIYRCPRTL